METTLRQHRAGGPGSGVATVPGMAVVDRIPWGFVLILCVALGLAPFFEEPHLVEKIRLLVRGDLRRAIDWFDLLWHSWRFAILAAKLARLRTVDAET